MGEASPAGKRRHGRRAPVKTLIGRVRDQRATRAFALVGPELGCDGIRTGAVYQPCAITLNKRGASSIATVRASRTFSRAGDTGHVAARHRAVGTIEGHASKDPVRSAPIAAVLAAEVPASDSGIATVLRSSGPSTVGEG